MANSSKYNASNPSNRHKGQTYFQTKSSNWNKILACHPARSIGKMEIIQKAAVRMSISFDVLPNLKDAPDYHQSKVKRNLNHGSGIIHPNHNSNEQISYIIPVIASDDVPTKDSVKIRNRNAFDIEDRVNGATITKTNRSTSKDYYYVVCGKCQSNKAVGKINQELCAQQAFSLTSN